MQFFCTKKQPSKPHIYYVFSIFSCIHRAVLLCALARELSLRSSSPSHALTLPLPLPSGAARRGWGI